MPTTLPTVYRPAPEPSSLDLIERLEAESGNAARGILIAFLISIPLDAVLMLAAARGWF